MFSEELISWLPTVNASLNGLAALLLAIGWVLIKRNQVTAHRNCMVAAFIVSAVFLACYLVYHFHHVATPFPGTGSWRYVYFAVLVPHIILAVVMLPMIFMTFWRAFRSDFEKHKKIARWTLPIWLYVSVTGVLVYVMLYQITWN